MNSTVMIRVAVFVLALAALWLVASASITEYGALPLP